MARRIKSSSKNFGKGNKPEYATKVALNEHFRNGHKSTVKTHVERSRLFYDWLDTEYDIRDVRLITTHILHEYALHLKFLMSVRIPR